MSKKGKFKQYTLDDGSITTAKEVSERVGVTVNNARTRLCVSSDPEKVFQPKQVKKTNNEDSYKMRSIKSKPASIYNEMFCLALKAI